MESEPISKPLVKPWLEAMVVCVALGMMVWCIYSIFKDPNGDQGTRKVCIAISIIVLGVLSRSRIGDIIGWIVWY